MFFRVIHRVIHRGLEGSRGVLEDTTGGLQGWFGSIVCLWVTLSVLCILWCSFSPPLVLLWCSFSSPLVLLWCSSGAPLVLLWFSSGSPSVLLWSSTAGDTDEAYHIYGIIHLRGLTGVFGCFKVQGMENDS